MAIFQVGLWNGLAPSFAGDVLHSEELGGPLEPGRAHVLPRDGTPITIDFEVRLPYELVCPARAICVRYFKCPI